MPTDLIDTLNSDLFSNDENRIQYSLGAIYWIADIHTHGGQLDDGLDSEPYYEELIKEDMNQEFFDGVKQLLRKFINETDPCPSTSSAIGILGKFWDSSDKELFEEYLERGLQSILYANGILHQSIAALQDISDIDVGSGISLAQPDRNIEIARAYLKRYGKEFSW